MAEEVQISLEEINKGDQIRVVRTNSRIIHVIEGIAERQDEDGDWLCGDDLLTYHDEWDEEYYLIKSGSLPDNPGTLITYPSSLSGDVYALKTYGEDGSWFTTFPDGSSAHISSIYISRKDWRIVS